MSPPDTHKALADRIPTLPRDDAGPVFSEPWQAQAFAMAVELNRQGLFTWTEWAAALAAELAAAGPDDKAGDYYLHWLSALERLVMEKSELGAGDLVERKQAWERAARATPHGRPIVLGAESR